MGISGTVRIMAILLAGLLFMQLDPGGAVVCLADNGRMSYSFSCTCDLPGEHKGGCSACSDIHADATNAKAETTGHSCCDKSDSNSKEDTPSHKGCCHNFRIELIASAGPQLAAPQWEQASQQLPGPVILTELVSADWSEARHMADLPPPLPERSESPTSLLSCVRLLL